METNHFFLVLQLGDGHSPFSPFMSVPYWKHHDSSSNNSV